MEKADETVMTITALKGPAELSSMVQMKKQDCPGNNLAGKWISGPMDQQKNGQVAIE